MSLCSSQPKVEAGVRIESFITGGYPGGGKPRPVSFPDPAEASSELDGPPRINLPPLIDLELASGMAGGWHRLQDFADVIALIKARSLPADSADQLNPYVRDRYLEMGHELQTPDPEEGVRPAARAASLTDRAAQGAAVGLAYFSVAVSTRVNSAVLGL